MFFASLASGEKDEPRNKKVEPTLVEQTPTPKRPAKFRAEVDQVVLHAAVYDENIQLVSGLEKEDFLVFEDRVEQELSYFGQEDVPTSIGLVLDISGSMRDKMVLVNEATKLFLDESHPGNELFLIEFNDEVILEENFTREVEDIRDALDNMIIHGGTALYDAIFLATDKARNGIEPKRVLVVFTDGEDKDSYYRHEELLDKIRESDVQVHVVAFLDWELSTIRPFFGIFKSQKQKLQRKLNTIAELTGGKAFFPEKVHELKDIFEAIAQELRNQYRLAYISKNLARDGSWRDIGVAVKAAKEKGWKVRAKKGYFARK